MESAAEWLGTSAPTPEEQELMFKVCPPCLRPRARQVELLTAQLHLERKVASLVEDAYGLTPEDRALLRATPCARPARCAGGAYARLL